MTYLLALVAHHAYEVLFLWVLLEQGGLPVPSVPVMLAVGTMSAAHELHVSVAIALTVGACVISDTAWYWLGWRYGSRVIEVLCRFSFEAATCVEKTQRSVTGRGAWTLLIAKFVPGLSQVSAPVAGQSKMPLRRFLVYDTAGSLLWATAWLIAGRFFGDIAKRSAGLFHALAHHAVLIVVVMVVSVVAYRWVNKQRFLAELRGLRLEPAQLLTMFEDAERAGLPQPYIVDLRHPLDVLTDPLTLPGAVQIGPHELKERRDELPRDRDVVLYCTCPSEETSAKVAMDLRKLGIMRVRPLRGGLQGWRDAGFPTQPANLGI
jgi:membrane protein DedA with SNARE-associated domain/rhodanese-related sulfurtransferase